MQSGLLPEIGPWLVCAVTVFIGTLVQRLSGAGYGMFAVGLTVLGLTFPISIGSLFVAGGVSGVMGTGALLNSRDAVQWRDLPPRFAGRILGAGIAAYIATRLWGPMHWRSSLASLCFLQLV